MRTLIVLLSVCVCTRCAGRLSGGPRAADTDSGGADWRRHGARAHGGHYSRHAPLPPPSAVKGSPQTPS